MALGAKITESIPMLEYSGAFLRMRDVTEADWEVICSQSGPFRLDLAFTTITDEDLSRLHDCDELRFVSLTECRNVTDEAIALLQEKLPSCTIELKSKSTSWDWRRALSSLLIVGGLAGVLMWVGFGPEHEDPMEPHEELPGVLLVTPKMNDPLLEKLKEMPDLESLIITQGCKVDPEGFRALLNLKRLKTLVLVDTLMDKDAFDVISQLKSLEQLHLNGRRVTDSMLAKLTTLSELNTLGIPNAQYITDNGLRVLKDMPKLNSLYITESRQMTDEGLKYIAECKELNSLMITSCKLVSDNGMKHIANLEKLRMIGLERTAITHVGLDELVKCPNLQHVLIGSEKIDDMAVATVAKYPQLAIFSISNSFEVTNRGIGAIMSLPGLLSLSISACHGISDAAFAPLKNNRNLSSVRIVGCNMLSDEALDHLPSQLGTLVLGISNDDHFTKKGIRRFKRTHPKCKFYRAPDIQEPL